MFLALALLAAAQGADWPGFLGPNRDGISSERGLPTAWPPDGPRVVWQKEAGEGHATASVAGGKVYFFDRHAGRARLRCMKAATGDDLWTFGYDSDYQDDFGAGNGPRCVPVVDGDRVYTFDPAGVLHCVRTADGTVVWKKDTSKDFGVVQNFFGVGSTPLIEGDLLIAMIGGSPAGSPPITSGEVRGLDSGIVAFDKRTGAVRYKATSELASYSSPTVATIGGRRWGFVFARGGLVGFDPATGKVDFHYPWRAPSNETVSISNPVIVGDQVFVSEAYAVGSSLLRVKPGGYDVVWSDGRKRDQAMAAYWTTPIHVDGHLYGASGGAASGSDLRCIELSTGKVKWFERDLDKNSLLLVDGRFVALGEDGALRLLKPNPERCEVLAKAVPKRPDGTPLLRSPARAAPVLSHGLLYLRGRDRIACLELIPTR